MMESKWYDVAHKAGFAGIEPLRKATKKPKSQVDKWLRTQRTYLKHRHRIRKFTRAKVFSPGLGVSVQGDTFHCGSYWRSNRGFRYILLVVDCFTNRIFCRLMKRNNATQTSEAFASIFTEMEQLKVKVPRFTIGLDGASEFYAPECRAVFEKFGATAVLLRHPLKAQIAERCGRLVLSKVERYLTANRTKKFHDKFQSLIDGLNARPLKSLGGKAPRDINFDNQHETFYAKYPNHWVRKNYRGKRHAIGTRVILPLDVNPFFHKGRKGHWATEKVYLVDHIRQSNPFRYSIRDPEDNLVLDNTFYYEDLLAVE